MVKFSKQFEGQLIPEWKDAFVDYWELKKDIKRIHLLNNDNLSNKHQECSLPSTFFNSLRSFSLFGHQCRDHGIIQVHKKLASSSLKTDMYKTDLAQFAETDAANEFFARLDHQLFKVNQFYKTKEKEFTERGESLKKQMDILIELKTALKQQGRKAASAPYLEEDSSISSTISSGSFERNDEQFSDSSKSDEMMEPMKTEREDKQKGTLYNHTLYCLVWEDLVSQISKKCGSEGCKLRINKTKLHHAEKMIREAFTDLFKGLGYLKTYRNLNMLAFVKILKKFDKVTGKQVLPVYHKVVESSYFNSSDKVVKLADEVEELFIKHFADNDKRKAMKYLRPHQRKESHAVTFFIGLFTGFFVALFSGYIIMAHISGIYTRHSDSVYMETVYPVLSMFSLLFLHFFLYGCNIFMWKRSRINYSFIFELSPTKELKCRDVFLICTLSMATVLGVMFVHLTFIARGNSSTHVQAIPGFLLLIFLLLLVCPFNIVYRSSRYRFVRVMRNIMLSPFYKVVMLDFFMADQLCSQVPMLRSLEYSACYYITGCYRTQDYGFCKSNAYKDLSYAVSFLPYYWRAMQCARRWFDEGETSHLINLGKYVSAMLAAGAKVAYEKEGTIPWLCLIVVTSSVATLYHLYWDFVKDWGLLQFNSKNPWLRNELVLRRKITYFFSMGVNLVLRLAWLQTVLHSNVGSLDYRVTTFLLAALEVIRRGQWNFYRLENEHLNNTGKFRAVKTVPLPFQNADEQD